MAHLFIKLVGCTETGAKKVEANVGKVLRVKSLS